MSRRPSREPRLLLRGKKQAKLGTTTGVHNGLGVAPRADWGLPFQESAHGLPVSCQTKPLTRKENATRSQGMYKLEQQSHPPEIAVAKYHDLMGDPYNVLSPRFEEEQDSLNMFIVGGPFGGWDNRISGGGFAARLGNRSPLPRKVVEQKAEPPLPKQGTKEPKPAGPNQKKPKRNKLVSKLKLPKTARHLMRIGRGRLEFLSPRQHSSELTQKELALGPGEKTLEQDTAGTTGASKSPRNVASQYKQCYFAHRKIVIENRARLRRQAQGEPDSYSAMDIDIAGDRIRASTSLPARRKTVPRSPFVKTPSVPVESMQRYRDLVEPRQTWTSQRYRQRQQRGNPRNMEVGIVAYSPIQQRSPTAAANGAKPRLSVSRGYDGQLYRGKLVAPFLRYKAEPTPADILKRKRKKRTHIPVGFQTRRGHLLSMSYNPTDDFCDPEEMARQNLDNRPFTSRRIGASR